MKTQPCLDCQQPFEVRSGNHRRCRPCAKKRNRARAQQKYFMNDGLYRNRHVQRTHEWRKQYARDRAREMRRLFPEREREKQLRRFYGITLTDYRAMLEAQGNICPLCDAHLPKPRRLWATVDHCHVTKRVRGLLCAGCNTKLGWLENRWDSIMLYLGRAVVHPDLATWHPPHAEDQRR